MNMAIQQVQSGNRTDAQASRKPTPPADLPAQVAENRARHGLWPAGDREHPCTLVIGVSGGADSVALLHALARLAQSANWRLYVAHLDHNLRPESAADAAFVARQARVLGLPFHGERLEPNALAGDNLEAAARRARYGFLIRVALNVTPPGQVPVILTAHHADDQAETVLLHLIRGAGLDGLGGMAWLTELTTVTFAPEDARAAAVPRMKLARPLLNVTRGEIRAWLTDQEIEWREDATNQDASLVRNRLRHFVLPQLESINPQVVRALGRTADLLADEAARLQRLDRAELDALLLEPSANGTEDEAIVRVVLDVSGYSQLDEATQRGVLRAALAMLLPGRRDLTFGHVEGVRAAVAEGAPGGGPHPLIHDVAWTLAGASAVAPARLSLHRLDAPPFSPGGPHLGAGWETTDIVAPGETRCGRWTLAAHFLDRSGLPEDWRSGSQPWRAFLDAARASRPALAAAGSLPPGARFAPLGMAGRRKQLGDFFTDRKIPVSLRPGWPLIIDRTTGEILWVCGLQPGERAKIDDRTRRVLALAWTL
jgi:tRNA(Ile)-lysidine synthase